jgi:WD40 repeat protein
MHTAPIRRIAVDASCSLLVTGSEDKTVRLWRLPDGRFLNTLRPPIGEGAEGKVYAVAVAPDAGWIAAGGWTRTGGDHWVYIFQAATGAMVTRFGPFRQVIANLAVSADGRRLAATFWRGGGLRAWERHGGGLANWELIAEDTNYHGRDSNGATFDATGELFTVADDGQLRRYDLDRGGTPKIAPTRGGRRPYSVSVNPIDHRLAVGFADRTSVDVYEPNTLSWVFTTEGRELGTGGFGATAWSASGDRLFAGGTYARGRQYPIRVWDREGKAPHELEGTSDTIMQLLPCGDSIAVAAGDPAFGLVSSAGSRQLWRGPITADMRSKLGSSFMISSDARRVRFGLGEGGDDPVLFDVEAQRVVASPERPDDLFPAETTGLPIEGWVNTLRPTLAGVPIRLDTNERSQSLAIAREKDRFVLGSDYYLRVFDRAGGLLRRKQAPGVFWGMNISRDNRLIVAASGDGTIRWYRLDNGQELLALFVQRELRNGQRDWVAWTPKGYYMASPRGGDLIGWNVNRGWDQSADFFVLSQFRDTFDRPDIVRRVLASLDEDKAVDEANAFLNKRRANEDVKQSLPPVVTIVSPLTVTYQQTADQVTIRYALRSPSGLPVTRVFALVDGHPLPGAATIDVTLDAHYEAIGELKVKLTPSSGTISVIAESADLWSAPADLIIGGPAGGVEPTIKPRLYALIIGVGDYQRVSKLGNIPANDAEAMSTVLRGQEGEEGAFAKVDVKTLKDSDATHNNILDGLQWLSDSARDPDNDIALIYFSGHGLATAGGSYLLPVDFDPDKLFRTGLAKKEVLQDLSAIPARVVFFVDACHAAADLYSRAGVRMLDTSSLLGEFSDPPNGITAFASSQGSEFSRAAPGATNSYFTQALIDGLRGSAAPKNSRIILTVDLPPWLDREVPRLSRLSGELQTPIMVPPWRGIPPPLAAVRQ